MLLDYTWTFSTKELQRKFHYSNTNYFPVNELHALSPLHALADRLE